MNPVNMRDDIGLSDQDLILMPTKELNKLLKKRNICKARAKQIKAERRTLKNRYQITIRARLHYVTKPCDVGHMTVYITFNTGLGTLKTKSGRGFPRSWVGILS